MFLSVTQPTAHVLPAYLLQEVLQLCDIGQAHTACIVFAVSLNKPRLALLSVEYVHMKQQTLPQAACQALESAQGNAAAPLQFPKQDASCAAN